MSEKQLETRTLLGFPQYLFREDGVVLNLGGHGWMPLRTYLIKDRPFVTLRGGDGRVRLNCSLATFICAAFHGPRPHNLYPAFRDGNRQNCDAANLYYGPRRTRWKEGYVAQSQEVARALSRSCRECGGFFDAHDMPLVTGQKDRRCRFCRGGLLADVAEHESREAALALFGVPTQSTEVLLDIRHIHDELWRRLRSKFTDTEQYVLYARFWEDLTLDEVGDVLGVSGPWMRQVEIRSIRRLQGLMWAKRKRYIYPFSSSFAEESYQGPRSVARKEEEPEEPQHVVHRVEKPRTPEVTVDFEALAALLES